MSNPTFQHRHYKAVANAIMGLTPLASDSQERWRQWGHTKNEFATMFERDNPRFDRTRFYAACDGTPSNGRDKVQS